MNVTLTFPGKSSSQSFQFFFNVTDQEIFEIPDCIKLMEACPSVTASTKLYLKMHTESDKSYGRMLVEMPMPTESAGQAFMLCSFGEIIEGRGVSSRRNTIITRRDDGMIGKVHDEFTTLIDSSVHNGKVNSHHVKLVMIVTYINDSLHINNSPLHFEASIVSNNVTVWRGKIPIHRPAIEYYPDFIVLTEITKAADVNPSNLAYLYSQNGSYYHREAVVWNKGSDVYRLEFPKVIAYFSFSASPCDVICGVTAVWSPLLDYVTIVNDDNKVMLRMLPYALDQDINTCFDLPVPGDFPSMLWLRIKNMSLFGVTSQKFVVHAIGEGIECTRIGQKSIQVGTSKPADSNNGSIDSYVEFCKIVSHNSAATITYCDIECVCNNCSYVDIVMQSANTKPWRLCELTPEDVIQSKRQES
ncbi:uncharacterized protein LOC132551513 [Ylistrum balloti]|uniref:uncharacterized protein LOC132551513 n=1 Tax=Ylistrum balloti TaxID=509963 RepID=UPI002905C55A|nr:uncharacterized protein LOC132551513 [Ylistrum balloti]